MYDSYQYNSLEHFGIKGMKWGIRRTPDQLGHRSERKQKKQRTPEEQAKHEARKAKVIKYAKRAAKVAAVGLGATLAVSQLASGNPAGAVNLGSRAVSQLLSSGMLDKKTAATLVSQNLAREGTRSLGMSTWNNASNPYYIPGQYTPAQQDLMRQVLEYQLKNK